MFNKLLETGFKEMLTEDNGHDELQEAANCLPTCRLGSLAKGLAKAQQGPSKGPTRALGTERQRWGYLCDWKNGVLSISSSSSSISISISIT